MIHTPPDRYPEPSDAYLAATHFLDSDNGAIRDAACAACQGATSDIEKGVKLFYWVRDSWRYNPFAVSFTSDFHVASKVLQLDHGYCVNKAILLATAARAVGIPSAIGMSDVENHLSSEKLKQVMGGSSLFRMHGFALLHLDGHWVKAAPAFNREMCERFGVRPTEFDGRADAILQEYDMSHRRHMEYVHEHGYWSDFPFEYWHGVMDACYPLEHWHARPVAQEFVPDGQQ